MSEKKDSSKSPRDTGGPVVKTGPTAGQNRSRNEDGAWRKKRSDAGEPRKKTGCFITTAVCEHRGLPDDCAELTILRHFRDTVLCSTPGGRALVAEYYAIAPAIAVAMTPTQKELSWAAVEAAVAAIRAGRYKDATELYHNMVCSLGAC